LIDSDHCPIRICQSRLLRNPNKIFRSLSGRPHFFKAFCAISGCNVFAFMFPIAHTGSSEFFCERFLNWRRQSISHDKFCIAYSVVVPVRESLPPSRVISLSVTHRGPVLFQDTVIVPQGLGHLITRATEGAECYRKLNNVLKVFAMFGGTRNEIRGRLNSDKSMNYITSVI
jgi:hypothetical protein